MCGTSIAASCGWSLLTDCAAHSDTHSRTQPQEHVTSQGARTQLRGEMVKVRALVILRLITKL